jgi:hypothetical protein
VQTPHFSKVVGELLRDNPQLHGMKIPITRSICIELHLLEMFVDDPGEKALGVQPALGSF